MITNPPITTSLRAEIVPQREFALRRWFYASPLWYYHGQGINNELNLDQTFYQRVDPDLRDLCKLLHAAGVRTTPSCQGHFYGREHFEKTWDELEREEALIQTSGLPVKDCETDEALIFRTSSYQLPWPRFADFYDQVVVDQTKGYLGILVPRHWHELCCRLHNDQYRTPRSRISFDGELSCLLDGSLFDITVVARNPHERRQEWNAITTRMANLLEDIGTRSSGATICA